MKIAFIHNDKKIGTGAHYINDLMANKLRELAVDVKNFYPRTSLIDTPVHLNGFKNILFFYSLLERRKEILKLDVIQGTTYTPLPFLTYPVPVVSHFGSTTRGFLDATPLANKMEKATKKIWYKLRKSGVINELNIKTRRPLRDIADMEAYVASRVTAVIATSEHVRNELIVAGVPEKNIHLIHNAIEDYWFDTNPVINQQALAPAIVFLGRLGSDAFTLKLKGLDRLIDVYQKFPNIPKYTFCISINKKLMSWMRSGFQNHYLYANIKKDLIPPLLAPLCGNILFIPSRYEGFSLSLIEGMSQGLIPVMYKVGVAPEIIKNRENGFLVSSQDEAFACISRIINDSSLRAQMSSQAIITASKFRGSVISKKLATLYSSLIPEKIPGYKCLRKKTDSIYKEIFNHIKTK